jgi:septal ring factor EnvC (AmiA/AmiB activator)
MLEIEVKEKFAQDEALHSMCEAAEICVRTCQGEIDVSVSLLREIDEFVKSEQQQLLDILEFGPFYSDITNIVEEEANVTRRIAKLQSVSQHFDMRGEKKLQSNLSEQIKVIEIELQKQKQASTIHASQLSHIEAALDSQAASFESEFEALNSHIKKLQEEKNSLYAKEMTLRKNIQRMTATINARAKRAMTKGGA